MGFRLMPNFRASSASLTRPPGLRRPDVISFNRKLRTCSDKLSVSKNEITSSHAEILGGPSALFRLQLQTVDRKKSKSSFRRSKSGSQLDHRSQAKCAAPVTRARSSRSLDCMIFRCTTSDRRKQTACHPSHQSGVWPWYHATVWARFSHPEFGASGQWTHWPAGKRHGYEAFISFGALKRARPLAILLDGQGL